MVSDVSSFVAKFILRHLPGHFLLRNREAFNSAARVTKLAGIDMMSFLPFCFLLS